MVLARLVATQCPSSGHCGALAVPGTLQQHSWLQHVHFWKNYRTFAPMWSITPCLYCPWCQSGPCFGVVSSDPHLITMVLQGLAFLPVWGGRV